MIDKKLEALEAEEHRLHIESYNAQKVFDKAKEAYLDKRSEYERAFYQLQDYKKDKGDYDG